METALKVKNEKEQNKKILWQDIKEDRGYRVTVIVHNEKGAETIYEKFCNKSLWNPFTKQYESQTRWYYVDSFVIANRSKAINYAERLTKELENLWREKQIVK